MNHEHGGIQFLVLAIVVLASFIIAGGTLSFNNSLPRNGGQAVNIQDIQPGPAQNTLQISGLATATPTPIAPPTPNPVIIPIPPVVNPPAPNPTPNPQPVPPPVPYICQGTAVYCSCQTNTTDGHRIVCPDLLHQQLLQYCLDTLNARDSTCIMTPALTANG